MSHANVSMYMCALNQCVALQEMCMAGVENNHYSKWNRKVHSPFERASKRTHARKYRTHAHGDGERGGEGTGNKDTCRGGGLGTCDGSLQGAFKSLKPTVRGVNGRTYCMCSQLYPCV